MTRRPTRLAANRLMSACDALLKLKGLEPDEQRAAKRLVDQMATFAITLDSKSAPAASRRVWPFNRSRTASE